MDAWSGMERFLHLSLGSQVGASGVALIAVLALKARLQYPAGCQGQSETSACIVRLTAEEWRTVAGIHERKTFERAKAKLVELEVLHIERKGRLLEVTLWPDPLEQDFPEENSQVELNTEAQSDLKPSLVMGIGTSCETSHETELETDYGTPRGTSFERSHDLETSSETGNVSLSKCVLMSREDEVFPRPDVTENVDSPTFSDRNSLLCHPLNRYPLHRQPINTNNDSNGTTNNDQRCHKREDKTIAAPASEREGLLEFAILWVQEVGHPLTPYEKEGLVRFMRLGYTEELFVEALRCAVAADNRRMGYILGILRNWYQEGVRCLEDVAEAKKHWDDLRFLKRA